MVEREERGTFGARAGAALAGAVAACLVVFAAAAAPAHAATSGSADLRLALTDAPDPVSAGKDVAYTMTITNAGPSAATGVTLVDDLPAGAAFVSASPSQGQCAPPKGTRVGCALGTLAAGAFTTVTIAVASPASGVGALTDAASVSAQQHDPAPGDNRARERTIVEAPDSQGRSGYVPPPGGFVSTNLGHGTSRSDPHVTTALVPSGQPAGTSVVLAELPTRNPHAACAPGFTCFGQISSIRLAHPRHVGKHPPFSPTNPLRFFFTFDPSEVPAGVGLEGLHIFHNGRLVPVCSSPSSGVASPDPCVARRFRNGDGDFKAKVLSTVNGKWRG